MEGRIGFARAPYSAGNFPRRQVSLEEDFFPAALASGQRLFGIEFPAPLSTSRADDYRRARAAGRLEFLPSAKEIK